MTDIAEVHSMTLLKEDIPRLDSNIEKTARYVELEWTERSKPPSNVVNVTYYEVGKLAFDLLPTLLSKLKRLGGPKVQEISVIIQSHPPFHLSKNDPLEFGKVKTAQAIEEFLRA